MAKLERKPQKSYSPISEKLLHAASGLSSPPARPIDMGEEGENVVPLRTGSEEAGGRKATRDESSDIERPEDKLTESMRYRVSRVERRETEKFLARLSDAANMSLTHSNIMRACREILFELEEKIAAELRRENLKRPINDRRALALFEGRLKEIIQTAIHESPLPYNIREHE